MPHLGYVGEEIIGGVGHGDATPETMRIFLYPWSERQVAPCTEEGFVVEALRDSAEQLYEYGAIERGEIWRFSADEFSFPASASPTTDVDEMNSTAIEDTFVSWLETGSGTGANLHTLTGVHQLVHGGPTGCTETAGETPGGHYAPAGAGAELTPSTAFGTGVAAWSPVCENEGLSKNAAIQEALHTLIGGQWSQWAGTTAQLRNAYGEPTEDSEQYKFDQHTLGATVPARQTSGDTDDDRYLVTPMLTYHWDDDPQGGCRDEYVKPAAHTQELTVCTKEAIEQTPK